MAGGLRDLVAKLRLDTTQFSKGIRGVAGTLKAVGAAMTATSAGVALAIRGQLNAADEMSKSAQRLGVPIETLSKLRHAANMSGVGVEQLSVGLKTMSRQMAEAAGGSKAALKIFDDLGVSAMNADGSLRSTEQVMSDVAESLSKMPDGAQKTALAMKLFGESGAALIPMLNGGASGLEAMMKEAESLGIVFDAKTGKAAENFNDNISRLKASLTGLVIQLAAALAPTLETISAKAVEMTKWFRDLSPETQALAAKFAAVALAAGPVVFGLGLIAGSLGVVTGALKALTLAMIKNPLTALAVGVVAGAVAIYTYWEPIKQFFADLWAGIEQTATDAWDGVKQLSSDAVMGTLAAWNGIREVFAAVLVNVKQAFVDGWEAIKAEVSTWPARFVEFGGQIVEGLKQGIIEKWDAMMAGLRGKWQELKDGFADALGIRSPSRVFRGFGRNISEGLALGIKDQAPMVNQAMTGLGDGLEGAGDSLTSKLDSFKSSFESAFVGFVTGAMTAKDALRQLAGQLAQMAAKAAFNGLFGGLFGGGKGGGLLGSLFGFAKGGAFSGGRLQAFAKGGVVAGATAFAMQGGLGVMGEAGPEAIMPLSRGADGKLGVKSGGGGVVQVVVSVDGSGNLQPVIQSVSGSVVAQALTSYDRNALPGRVAQINRNPRAKG